MTYRPVMLSALVALALAAPAAAQTSQQPSGNQSIGGGAQWAYPDSMTNVKGTPGINVSWRYWTGPHLGLEATFGWWRDTDRGEYHSESFVAYDGTLIPRQDVTYEQTLSAYALGFNLLGRLPLGSRVAFVAGGGPGFYTERGLVKVTVNGRDEGGDRRAQHFGVQGLGELEVRAAGSVFVYGGFRVEWRDVRSVESGFAYPTLGVRAVF